MPQSSKIWFGLVQIAYNLLNQIEKKYSKMLFGLVYQNVFGTDCYSVLCNMHTEDFRLKHNRVGILCVTFCKN